MGYKTNCFELFQAYLKLAEIMSWNQRRPLTDAQLAYLWQCVCKRGLKWCSER